MLLPRNRCHTILQVDCPRFADRAICGRMRDGVHPLDQVHLPGICLPIRPAATCRSHRQLPAEWLASAGHGQGAASHPGRSIWYLRASQLWAWMWNPANSGWEAQETWVDLGISKKSVGSKSIIFFFQSAIWVTDHRRDCFLRPSRKWFPCLPRLPARRSASASARRLPSSALPSAMGEINEFHNSMEV